MYYHRSTRQSRGRLGAEEGQVRLTCEAGTTKVYLPDHPWEACIPDGEVAQIAPYKAPPLQPPGQERLKIEHRSTQTLGQANGATALTPGDLVVRSGLCLGLGGLALWALGAFK